MALFFTKRRVRDIRAPRPPSARQSVAPTAVSRPCVCAVDAEGEDAARRGAGSPDGSRSGVAARVHRDRAPRDADAGPRGGEAADGAAARATADQGRRGSRAVQPAAIVGLLRRQSRRVAERARRGLPPAVAPRSAWAWTVGDVGRPESVAARAARTFANRPRGVTVGSPAGIVRAQ